MRFIKIFSFLATCTIIPSVFCMNAHASAGGLSNKDILEYYNQQWRENVDCSVREKVKGDPSSAFFDLPDHLLPMPPVGTVWHREGNVLQLRQHSYYTGSVPNVEFYTFSGKTGDDQSRFAYLSLVDGVTMHGYTDCVPESFESHPKAGKLRDYYPPSVDGKKFTRDGVSYWRGHTLDFSTTICNDPHDPWLFDISTRLSETFVPEPYGSWAQTIATQRVKKLRDIFGGYSRLFVYPFAKKSKRMAKCLLCTSKKRCQIQMRSTTTKNIPDEGNRYQTMGRYYS